MIKPVGVFQLFFEDGQLKEKYEYVNGLRHGRYIQHYDTGALKLEGRYVNGERSGPFITYFESGEERAVLYYEYGKLVSGGTEEDEEDFMPYIPLE